MNHLSKRDKIKSQHISSEEEESTEHRLLENKEIEELYESYTRIKQFCQSLPDSNGAGFGDLVRRYCNRRTDFDLPPKNVMQIMDKRIQRMLKNKRIKKNWSEEDTKILLWTFSHYAHKMGVRSVEEATLQDWANISALVPGSYPDSCMFKILSLKKVKLSERRWTDIEESILFRIVSSKKKKNWRAISQQLYKEHQERGKIFRNAKQCKEHWMCYLNPELKKGPWDKKEDQNLMEYISVNGGAKRWAEIAKIFRGRTQNALKNRYTLLIDRLRKQKNSNNEMELIQHFLAKEEHYVELPHSPPRTRMRVETTQDHRVEPAPEIFEDEHFSQPLPPQNERNFESAIVGTSDLPALQAGVYSMPTHGQQFSFFYPHPQSFFWMLPGQPQ